MLRLVTEPITSHRRLAKIEATVRVRKVIVGQQSAVEANAAFEAVVQRAVFRARVTVAAARSSGALREIARHEHKTLKVLAHPRKVVAIGSREAQVSAFVDG